ncbi:MAG: hypothetical protein A2Y00_01240 [Omnitrophica WOR_2 bacterium GWF2_43_52]|nr:MAG: hypothetical protein A2062_06045 [Omnitrophica WOR_2 bacterium GWA2_44_7]OGX14621.1 MAG: hypothetical protein A2Y01_02905 [Omnitrophica WOR_2 bacterium GWC2_44_8]OGX22032.1 MAG: hypothetical protein A2Y00_01240 [Omnitrophica WOR_2 bacterium GWF2_43_52]OGX56711.1 MAG: hypothetical protein A2460_06925 [Omnitrophica WOR_2 bacterium RIFOXYC2_FULL_43_9]HAH20002.1 hypothetical protein [Candidatus Omnitrophota bacterium]
MQSYEQAGWQGYVFAASFGLLLRQASLGVNFCAPRYRSESKPQKFPYVLLKHNLTSLVRIKLFSNCEVLDYTGLRL